MSARSESVARHALSTRVARLVVAGLTAVLAGCTSGGSTAVEPPATGTASKAAGAPLATETIEVSGEFERYEDLADLIESVDVLTTGEVTAVTGGPKDFNEIEQQGTQLAIITVDVVQILKGPKLSEVTFLWYAWDTTEDGTRRKVVINGVSTPAVGERYLLGLEDMQEGAGASSSHEVVSPDALLHIDDGRLTTDLRGGAISQQLDGMPLDVVTDQVTSLTEQKS